MNPSVCKHWYWYWSDSILESISSQTNCVCHCFVTLDAPDRFINNTFASWTNITDAFKNRHFHAIWNLLFNNRKLLKVVTKPSGNLLERSVILLQSAQWYRLYLSPPKPPLFLHPKHPYLALRIWSCRNYAAQEFLLSAAWKFLHGNLWVADREGGLMQRLVFSVPVSTGRHPGRW